MKTEVGLDQKDLMILYFLQQDSRMSLSEIGKNLDMTPAAVSYRLNKLIEQGVILKFSIVLNHELLTPNYHSFLVELSVYDKSKLSEVLSLLYQSTYFDRIIEVARPNSITGITLPLSNANLKDLTDLLNDKAIEKYSITPILVDHAIITTEVVGENVSHIYCPLCQKSIKGEGIVTKIGTKHMAFCCRECMDQFNINYKKITEE